MPHVVLGADARFRRSPGRRRPAQGPQEGSLESGQDLNMSHSCCAGAQALQDRKECCFLKNSAFSPLPTLFSASSNLPGHSCQFFQLQISPQEEGKRGQVCQLLSPPHTPLGSRGWALSASSLGRQSAQSSPPHSWGWGSLALLAEGEFSLCGGRRFMPWPGVGGL